ncbi:MAG: glycine--tRNA ligase [Chloroflexi bacterium]|nr:glycine--tRNA ligase [Chloroflexota bacterium]
MEKLVSLCKRRGIIFPGSEIYEGLGGTWDYGPLGVELKRNLKDAWWRAMVYQRDDMVGLDSALLMNPRVWEASGHIKNFTDPMVDCRSCNKRFRADHLESNVCPACGAKDQFTDARMFNLMFKTFVGPVEEDASTVYLRPETAQGIFVNFDNVLQSMRRKLPFGVAQIGKSFRNEITPGNFTFRSREFEQMEMEYFVQPGADMEWYEYWRNTRLQWYLDLGMNADNLRFDVHPPEKLSHYSKGTTDIQYLFPWGWDELEGIANRADYDLKQHMEFSGKRLSVFDEEAKEQIVPYVIEPAAGADRGTLAFLVDAYDEEVDKDGTRVVLRFHPRLAPVKVAILPLSRKEPLVELGRKLYAELRGDFVAQYDDAQSIGRRYRRQDEIGTPLCVTVDFDSLDDQQVTVRERDSMTQVRVPIAEIKHVVREKLGF